MDQGTYASARREEVDIEANKPLGHGQDRSYQDAGYEQAYHGDGGYAPTYEDEPGPTLDSYDIIVRQGFVRKVFGILTLQLGVTFSFVLLCALHKPTREYMNPEVRTWPFTLGMILTFGSLIGMMCCGNVMRVYPTNYIFLTVFTLAETLMLGSTSAMYDAQSVSMACGTTFAIVAALTVFAMQTKYDFTGMGPYLLCALWGMVMYSFIAMFIGGGTGTLYAFFGTILFSFYIVYDTQIIVGGKHRKYQIGVDDYVFAAMALYLDIINLFLYLLQLFGNRN
uniref:Uncharacterized protein n=1 Tax=Mucochytrium quahogii TaxID=96639 RepID=A0A7S2WBH6_9STRA|mmetsp:Transcript_13396/g.21891  ORF Transcript_13396/g.21891 Transcript_13396/m.21891 type:complete len:281 (+) Transcript_13396:268-1110(+)|eukprot:CAMPEP_0203776332 /NCGR_PEP_ID=MMETSP0099_2-20121227/6675_1 /ASSEMBLY_ACC=CAM_ASM_000209 /TAXON_ID=96639 /ORGANISM=" , Strain NY0313808BC1" /LENGTH=280 /DNA_ID=CAMNT_0050675303 /DNA_START=241 /DNA_END=1083 /DNA_ORIENTATION=+